MGKGTEFNSMSKKIDMERVLISLLINCSEEINEKMEYSKQTFNCSSAIALSIESDELFLDDNGELNIAKSIVVPWI
jgi:hypothetical protein